MAKAFLSYDREDGDKARAMAAALEQAGHEVWWDRHIIGGAEYSEEIEQALDRADAVVVLWSTDSVKSAWVRDEAAAGRDSARLVPVLLDGVKPPMGFRQYQTIDLSDWNHRRRSKHLDDLIAAIASTASATALRQPDATAATTSNDRSAQARPSRWKYPALAATLVVALGGGYWASHGAFGPSAQTVLISASDPRSHSLAHNLLVQLGPLQSTQSGVMRLVGDDSQVAKNANLILEASLGEDRGVANLALLAGKDRSLLWSEDFSESVDKQTSLEQRAATTAAKVLDCAIEGLSDKGAGLNQQYLKIYLNACASIADVGFDKRPLIAAFRQVTDAAPKFAAAWGRLLIAESDALAFLGIENNSFGGLETDLRRDIVSARKADPDLAQATLAEMAFMPPVPFAPPLEKIDEAKAQDPRAPEVLAERSLRLQSVGRMREAVDEARQASLADPLSPEARSTYISSAAYAGQIASAREELAKAFKLWPRAETLKQTQFAIDLRFGDYKKALVGESEDNPFIAAYIAMRDQPTNSNIHAFMEVVRSYIGTVSVQTGAFQALAEIDRPDEFFALSNDKRAVDGLQSSAYVLFRPWMASMRRDPRFMGLAQRIGLTDYWRQSGKWPDFCTDPGLPYDCKAEAAKYG